MLKSSLGDYSDAYILVCGTIRVQNRGTPANLSSRKKKYNALGYSIMNFINERNLTLSYSPLFMKKL